MGTRADFYVGRGESAEWIGSIGWDGYPDGIDAAVFASSSEAEFRENVTAFFAGRGDVTLPERGWPWPWADSRRTDYAYAFDGGSVHASCFGHSWFDPKQGEPEGDTPKDAIFPEMSSRRSLTLGPRSGLIVVSS